MKKAILAGFIVLAVLLLVSVVSHRTQKAAVQEKITVEEKVALPSATVRPLPAVGTVAWWDAMSEYDEARWMDSETEFMGTVVGPVAKATERWLGSVAPDLVYVEASKCSGNLRHSEVEACEVQLSRKLEKISRKCSDLRQDDVRPCVVSMDPQVEREEKAQNERAARELKAALGLK